MNTFRLQMFGIAMLLLLSSSFTMSCSTTTNVGQAGTTALLSEPATANAIDSMMRPVKKMSFFPPDTEKIYCCMKLSNAPLDTLVETDWVYVKGEELEENFTMQSEQVKTDGTRYIAFSCKRPGDAWFKGEYKVLIYLNGVPKISVPFVIQ